MVIRFRLPNVILIGALVALPASAAGQSVAVEVVSATGAKPLPGALISLRDSKDAVVKRTLADERGKATLTATPGVYRVRADAIGYQGVTSEQFDLTTGLQRIQLALTQRPLKLDEVVVTSKGKAECRLDPAEGTMVSRLWGEARKALLATQLTGARASVLDVKMYERDLDPYARIRTEQVRSARGSSHRPFVSADPELLHREGYVIQQKNGELVYNGPDADLLLSEAFLEDHCFQVGLPRAEDPPNTIGLRFEPVRSRQMPEIGGVLWLDRTTAELQSLEFSYRNVELPPEATGVGGRFYFGRLPNGGWIIRDWSIRMPHIAQRSTTIRGSRDTLMGFREAGGSARAAEDGGADPRSISVTGVVMDSTSGVPLPGVRVSIQAGAYADTTDAAGRYRINAPATGLYAVTFAHPMLGLVGLDSVVRGARLERGHEDSVDLAVPLVKAAVKNACPGADPRTNLGLVVGTVIDSATGKPVGGATVTANPKTRRLQSGSVVSERGVEYETQTNSDGYFASCAPPGIPELVLTGRTPAGRTLKRTVDIGASRLIWVELKVP